MASTLPGRGRPAGLAILSVLLWTAPRAAAATYYVRTDGGSETQCTGLANAPYPGSGAGQACAWDHPFRALPPGGSPRLSGGDTLVIGNGSYMMGLGAPGASDATACDPTGSWACYMPPVPSGPSSGQRTRIVGAGESTGCTSKPELWGTERAEMVLNLTDSSHVEVACLEVTDHSGCVESHSGGLACTRDTPPYGPWAVNGLYAEDASDVRVSRLDIHGFAHGGVLAGRLTDWTVEDLRIAGNGWVGWDGDIGATASSNAGLLKFSRWTVEWNGCAETYPGRQPAGCWAQTAGGYGDGVGTGQTGGNWLIEDSTFRYNTSDGLDLLYAREPGATITIRRTLAVGNAGNQIKTAGQAEIENSVIVGNCGYFDGQPFTHDVDNCRATGNALSIDLLTGDTARVSNSTIAGEGDCLVLAVCYDSCTGPEKVVLRNNLFQGYTDFLQPFENTCLAWAESFSYSPFDSDYSLVNGTKDTPPCPGAHDLCGAAAHLRDATLDAFDAHLEWNSAAIDSGTSSSVPGHDFDGRRRDARRDIGAYEWWRRRYEFDGDGRSDLAVYHAATGLWYVRRSSDGVTAALGFGGSGYETVEGDYDGDHRADHAVYHAATGLWFVRSSATGAVTSAGYGGVGYTPVPRDYDGDGKTDVAVYHEASGLWFVRRSSTGATWALGYGGTGFNPVPEDYDGDGQADLAVFHPATGLWFIRQSSTGTTWSQGFGGAGYTRVPRDYDGDGQADLAVYHAATGLWFVRQSTTGTTVSQGFGGPGYQPVPSDYDGDGHADLTVYHSTGGVWYVRSSATGDTSALAYGGSGFSPVAP